MATRLREDGATVYGFGESKTPASFSAACDWFVPAEVLDSAAAKTRSDAPAQTSPRDNEAIVSVRPFSDDDLKELITNAIRSSRNEDGWAPLARVGSHIRRISQSFDSRMYGHSRLSDMLDNLAYVELEWRRVGADDDKHVFVQVK